MTSEGLCLAAAGIYGEGTYSKHTNNKARDATAFGWTKWSHRCSGQGEHSYSLRPHNDDVHGLKNVVLGFAEALSRSGIEEGSTGQPVRISDMQALCFLNKRCLQQRRVSSLKWLLFASHDGSRLCLPQPSHVRPVCSSGCRNELGSCLPAAVSVSK